MLFMFESADEAEHVTDAIDLLAGELENMPGFTLAQHGVISAIRQNTLNILSSMGFDTDSLLSFFESDKAIKNCMFLREGVLQQRQAAAQDQFLKNYAAYFQRREISIETIIESEVLGILLENRLRLSAQFNTLEQSLLEVLSLILQVKTASDLKTGLLLELKLHLWKLAAYERQVDAYFAQIFRSGRKPGATNEETKYLQGLLQRHPNKTNKELYRLLGEEASNGETNCPWDECDGDGVIFGPNGELKFKTFGNKLAKIRNKQKIPANAKPG